MIKIYNFSENNTSKKEKYFIFSKSMYQKYRGVNICSYFSI